MQVMHSGADISSYPRSTKYFLYDLSLSQIAAWPAACPDRINILHRMRSEKTGLHGKAERYRISPIAKYHYAKPEASDVDQESRPDPHPHDRS